MLKESSSTSPTATRSTLLLHVLNFNSENMSKDSIFFPGIVILIEKLCFCIMITIKSLQIVLHIYNTTDYLRNSPGLRWDVKVIFQYKFSWKHTGGKKIPAY